MRRLIVLSLITLDGVMQATGGPEETRLVASSVVDGARAELARRKRLKEGK